MAKKDKTSLYDFKIEDSETVYPPSDDSYLLAENLIINQDETVLEIGTGSGIVAMSASLKTDFVTATDINYNAIELAEKNFKNNGITNIELGFGDLFEPVKNRKFDVILFNLPYLPTSSEEILGDDLNYAFDGGLNGRKTTDRFLNEVTNYLNNRGKVQLVQSSLSDNDLTISILKSLGFDVEITASERFFFEEIVVITGFKK
ncbi:MAG: HemK2/MTQ2 family protein methyltransferase [Methanobacteriaceae archaeon]